MPIWVIFFLASSLMSVCTLTLNVRLVQGLLIAWKWRESCRYCPRKYSSPLSIISCSQSQCEDSVAHKHSIDFRMWCTVSCGWLPGAPDTLTGQNSLMPAFARSTGCRIQMDNPVAFPIHILSLPAPALEKWVLLSHSVTLICHFLLNNRIFVTTNTFDVTNKLRKDKWQGNGGEDCEVMQHNVFVGLIWHLWCAHLQVIETDKSVAFGSL